MEETIYVLHEHSLSKDVGNLLTEYCTTTKNIVLKNAQIVQYWQICVQKVDFIKGTIIVLLPKITLFLQIV